MYIPKDLLKHLGFHDHWVIDFTVVEHRNLPWHRIIMGMGLEGQMKILLLGILVLHRALPLVYSFHNCQGKPSAS